MINSKLNVLRYYNIKQSRSMRRNHRKHWYENIQIFRDFPKRQFPVQCPTLETSRLTFTANVKPLTKFFTTIITAFTLVLKYIKQLLNLWYLTMIQENKLTTSHVFTKAVN